MEPYSPGVGGKLDVNLWNLLEECRVPQEIAAFLGEKGTAQVGAFSDLADSKDAIVGSSMKWERRWTPRTS